MNEVLSRQVWSLHAYRSVVQALTLPAAILATLLFLPKTGVSAQATLAAVRGTVQEQTGAPIPGTTVAAKNLETGRSRTVSSNAEGKFEIPQLAPGTYEVWASQAGFVSQTQKELQLRGGQSVTLTFVLKRGSRPQEHKAQDTGSEMAESSSATDQISESQLVGLPLNGRSYSQLATLQAGVSDPSTASGSRGIGGGGLTVAGGRTTSNSFLLDGTNILRSDNRAPRSAAGVQLGSDAVLQVQVFSANYSAEYGRGSGGVLNSITRSGTPEFHGTLFEFFRNSKLDARNFFDPGPEPPPFKRNQFGFTLTGPVLKDRTFFMASFEAMRDRLTQTVTNYFPDELARQGIITNAAGEVIRTVPVNLRVRPYLDLYPLPNSARVGKGIGENRASQALPTDENFFTVRVDHQISERDSFFARYSFDDANSQSSQGVFLFNQLTESRQQYLTLVGTHNFSPRALTTFRFGYTRPVSANVSLTAIEIPRSLFFNPDAPQFGAMNVPGLSNFGLGGPQPRVQIMNSFQFAEDMLAQRGTHALKLGFEIHRYRWDTFHNGRKGGVWSFNSLESFLQGGPEGTSLTVALPGSDNRTAHRQTFVGLYVQDEYKLSPRVQVDLGLRYEFATLIHDRNGRTVFLPDPVRDTRVQIGPLLENNPSLRNLSPRLGLSWSPVSSGNTVLRAGFGIYFDQMLQYVVFQRKSTVPFYKIALRTNFDSSTVFPDAVAATAGIPLMAHVMDYHHVTTPRVLRYNLTLQQRLPGGWRVRASYVGARGNHLYRGYEVNLFPVPIIRADGSLFFPAHDPNGPDNRVNSAFGGINIVSSDAQSFYNSLQLSANKRLGQGISLGASYTYSKSVDDSSAIPLPILTNTSSTQYGLMRTLDRGLSDFDIRHRAVMNYFYALPLGEGHRWWNSGILSHVFGGWRLGGIIRFRSGTPFSPQVNVRTPGYLFETTRPNLAPGRSNNPVEGVTASCEGVEAGQKLGGPDLYFDPCAFSFPEPGTLGNAGRNTLMAPSVFNVDISLQREFLLDAKRRLQFRAEFFNLPNHPNFGQASTSIFVGSSGRLNPTAGRIRSTATTARQVQFALRFSF